MSVDKRLHSSVTPLMVLVSYTWLLKPLPHWWEGVKAYLLRF
jgi:hypothetical protein